MPDNTDTYEPEGVTGGMAHAAAILPKTDLPPKMSLNEYYRALEGCFGTGPAVELARAKASFRMGWECCIKANITVRDLFNTGHLTFECAAEQIRTNNEYCWKEWRALQAKNELQEKVL